MKVEIIITFHLASGRGKTKKKNEHLLTPDCCRSKGVHTGKLSIMSVPKGTVRNFTQGKAEGNAHVCICYFSFFSFRKHWQQTSHSNFTTFNSFGECEF